MDLQEEVLLLGGITSQDKEGLQMISETIEEEAEVVEIFILVEAEVVEEDFEVMTDMDLLGL